MTKEYCQALTEVSEILKYTKKKVVDKISHQFLEYIEKNKDKEYKITLEENKKLLEQNIKPETKEIIALIYIDYICNPEEREKIIQEPEMKYKIDFKKSK